MSSRPLKKESLWLAWADRLDAGMAAGDVAAEWGVSVEEVEQGVAKARARLGKAITPTERERIELRRAIREARP